MKHAVMASSLIAVMAISLSPATAFATGGGPKETPPMRATDEQIVQVIADLNQTGHLSEGNEALLRSRPEVAAEVPIFDLTTTDAEDGVVDDREVPEGPGPEASPLAEVRRAKLATTRTSTTDRYIVYKNVLGKVLMRYHFTVDWNYNGSKVIGTPTRGHYMAPTNWAGGTYYDRGLTNNTDTALQPGPYAHKVRLAANWEICIIKYGCIYNGNPHAAYTLYGNGDYAYTPTP